jgi:hypothetical protein
MYTISFTITNGSMTFYGNTTLPIKIRYTYETETSYSELIQSILGGG